MSAWGSYIWVKLVAVPLMTIILLSTTAEQYEATPVGIELFVVHESVAGS